MEDVEQSEKIVSESQQESIRTPGGKIINRLDKHDQRDSN